MQPDEFVTADTHFGHSGIVRLAERPFETRTSATVVSSVSLSGLSRTVTKWTES